MIIGVVSVQGAISEHITILENAMANAGIAGEVRKVLLPKDLEGVSGILLPGGESTAISRLLTQSGLRGKIIELVDAGLPILGTCAGCIMLASEDASQKQEKGLELLKIMDFAVDRNAFGRQRESFETELEIDGLDEPFTSIFIRGPAIKRVWGDCTAIATLDDGRIVAAVQDKRMAIAFHPELTEDTRLHELFLKMC